MYSINNYIAVKLAIANLPYILTFICLYLLCLKDLPIPFGVRYARAVTAQCYADAAAYTATMLLVDCRLADNNVVV